MGILDNKKFDDWALKYDKQMKNSRGYPFEGYYNVLSYIRNLINLNSSQTKILDVGIGTGELSKILYNDGALIYGLDFSEKMIEVARNKMPNGIFIKCNFKSGIPVQIKTVKFNYIISSYALHHISDKEKINLISELLKSLALNGKIIIADIAFQNIKDLEKCKNKHLNIWDENEKYFIADNIIKSLKNNEISVTYQQISECAGVLQLG